jgi:hypothetical protein
VKAWVFCEEGVKEGQYGTMDLNCLLQIAPILHCGTEVRNAHRSLVNVLVERITDFNEPFCAAILK